MSGLWKHFKVLRITTQVRSSDNSSFKELLTRIAKGTLPVSTPLLLKSTLNMEEAYKPVCHWFTTNNIRDVDLKKMILCPANNLVDEHNKVALESFLDLFQSLSLQKPNSLFHWPFLRLYPGDKDNHSTKSYWIFIPAFSPWQLSIALSRVEMSTDDLLLHKEEHTLSNAGAIHILPVGVSSPFLKEVVTFSGGG